MSAWPLSHACHSAVQPSEAVAALASRSGRASSSCTTSAWLLRAAAISGVSPSLARALFTSAISHALTATSTLLTAAEPTRFHPLPPAGPTFSHPAAPASGHNAWCMRGAVRAAGAPAT